MDELYKLPGRRTSHRPPAADGAEVGTTATAGAGAPTPVWVAGLCALGAVASAGFTLLLFLNR